MMKHEIYNVHEIFMPNKSPIYTHINRSNHLERLSKALAMGNIAFIYGFSRTGKTTLAKHVAQPSHLISGVTANSGNEFWANVASELGIASSLTVEREITRADKKSVNYFAKIVANLIAEAGAQGEIEKSLERSKTISETTIVDIPQMVLKEKKVLIIDNFHFIKPEVQVEILMKLRGAIDKEESFPVIIVATTSESSYLSDRLSNIRMQVTPIEIGFWSTKELEEIPKIGFKKLNRELAPILLDKLIGESFGVPALMQHICLELAIQKGLHFTASGNLDMIDVDDVNLLDVYKSVSIDYGGDYSRLIRYAVERNHIKDLTILLPKRHIKRRERVSVHEAMLHAIVDNGEQNISLQTIEKDFRSLTIPDQQSRNATIFTETILEDLHYASRRVFEERIARDPTSTSDVAPLAWDASLKQVSMLDPLFAFYVRWLSQLTKWGREDE